MRLVAQRVSRAGVTVNGDTADIRGIKSGLVVLAGFCGGDNAATVDYMADKLINLRIFQDENGAMNLSLLDTGGELLVVSQFTLYANCRKGRRPSFIEAAKPDTAIPLYGQFLEALRACVPVVKCGEFGADMQVELVNDGPVTIILDSDEIMPKRQ